MQVYGSTSKLTQLITARQSDIVFSHVFSVGTTICAISLCVKDGYLIALNYFVVYYPLGLETAVRCFHDLSGRLSHSLRTMNYFDPSKSTTRSMHSRIDISSSTMTAISIASFQISRLLVRSAERILLYSADKVTSICVIITHFLIPS